MSFRCRFVGELVNIVESTVLLTPCRQATHREHYRYTIERMLLIRSSAPQIGGNKTLDYHQYMYSSAQRQLTDKFQYVLESSMQELSIKY